MVNLVSKYTDPITQAYPMDNDIIKLGIFNTNSYI